MRSLSVSTSRLVRYSPYLMISVFFGTPDHERVVLPPRAGMHTDTTLHPQHGGTNELACAQRDVVARELLVDEGSADGCGTVLRHPSSPVSPAPALRPESTTIR
jgi:hypothetical protein